jgi:hypothetical protein
MEKKDTRFTAVKLTNKETGEVIHFKSIKEARSYIQELKRTVFEGHTKVHRFFHWEEF